MGILGRPLAAHRALGQTRPRETCMLHNAQQQGIIRSCHRKWEDAHHRTQHWCEDVAGRQTTDERLGASGQGAARLHY